MSFGSLGSLVVSLTANTAQFHDAMGKAAHESAKAWERMQRDAEKHGKLIAGAALAAAASLAAIVKSAANSADELGKLSQKIGVSVEELSALKYAGSLADVSLEQLRTGLVQLSKHMVENGQAGQDVHGRLMELADQFKGMADGAEKTALAVKLFGRSGADMIPLLNQGRDGLAAAADEARRFGLIISAEAARQAEAFNDNLTRLTSAAEGLKIQLAGPLIKSLGDLAEQMLEGTRIAGGFGQALLTLGTINPFRSVGGNLRVLREELEELERQRAKRSGIAGFDSSLYDQRIAEIKKQIEFLQVMQRQAIAPVDDSMLDARDLALRNQKRAAQEAAAAVAAASMSSAEALRKEWKEREFIAKQWEEQQEEEIRIAGEVAHWTSFYRDQQLQKDREVAEQRTAAMIEFYEAEQERAIEQGAILAQGQSHSMQLVAFAESLKTQEQLESDAHAARMERLAEFSAEELEAFGGMAALREHMEAAHQNRLIEIERNKHAAKRQMEIGTLSLAGQLLQQFAGKSKAAALAVIAISKGLAIAQTIQSTAAAVMRAYADLGPIAGSAAAAWIKTLGGVQVGLIAATGLAEAHQATSGGGGGGGPPTFGAPATPVFSADPVTAQPAVRERPIQEVRIVIETTGPLERRVAEQIADGLSELHSDGYPMIFAVDAR
jgi:hypothetical protein